VCANTAGAAAYSCTCQNQDCSCSSTHFYQQAQRDDCVALGKTAKGTAILPLASVKVLGLTLGKKLTMDEHMSRTVAKGMRACLALQAIEGISPAQMRQLFRSCVLLITDYAASAWYGPGKRGTARLTHALDKVQRLGARATLQAWKKVALPILEAEVYLETTIERLERKDLMRSKVSHCCCIY
jgi:hypothetical protein